MGTLCPMTERTLAERIDDDSVFWPVQVVGGTALVLGTLGNGTWVGTVGLVLLGVWAVALTAVLIAHWCWLHSGRA